MIKKFNLNQRFPRYHPTLRCFRCGRNSHFADTCFAKTHYIGFKLKPRGYKRFKLTNTPNVSNDEISSPESTHIEPASNVEDNEVLIV